ncbi:hypothetical protein LEP1GSC058_1146 [Leptospira fainei serovar Hurstbridge str. BUT 6]|uniref:DUF4381 domain-containing protein n=1 Tax=Leptospira fainei serovar Hurstbridge str. BUT 6 TaxID=1193011 RepID=S3UWR8_9LEPT|nr:hypothetical protein [Leptospira fainei]EPG72809.1 hypothetical protein LEP1GSC058_1146 [Leptospira fainei serovar Hurstbridge str. BUT 6]
MRVVLGWLLLFLAADSAFAFSEEWSPQKVVIGQTSVYVLNFAEGEVDSPQVPALGIHTDSEAPDLPLFEVFSSDIGQNRIRLEVAYYASGTFILPITWKDSTGKENSSKVGLQVETSLLEKDKSPEDVLPPDSFSGPYGWRLIGLMAGIAALILSALYAYYLHRTRTKDPMDAILQTDPWIQKILRYENRLSELIESPPIPAREFYRLLSGYIREVVSKKLGSPTSHLTETELFARIFDSFSIDEEVIRVWESRLRKAQYSSEESRLTKDEAIAALDFWRGAFEK